MPAPFLPLALFKSCVPTGSSQDSQGTSDAGVPLVLLGAPEVTYLKESLKSDTDIKINFLKLTYMMAKPTSIS